MHRRREESTVDRCQSVNQEADTSTEAKENSTRVRAPKRRLPNRAELSKLVRELEHRSDLYFPCRELSLVPMDFFKLEGLC